MLTDYKIDLVAKSEDAARFRLKKGDNHLKFKEVFELWQDNTAFINFYKDELIKLNYPAFYWEHPALKTEFLNKNYECILLRSGRLEKLPVNEQAFKEHLSKKEEVVDFMNLGKNARLVVPTKKSEQAIYNHMGKFIRMASQKQITEVFKKIGQAITEEIEKQPIVWLNTAGLGVIWVHIRMDTRPKYYKTKQYKIPNFLEAKD